LPGLLLDGRHITGIHGEGVGGHNGSTSIEAPGPAQKAKATCYLSTQEPRIIYRSGRDDGAHDEAHTTDEPACALRGAPGGSSQPFLHREDAYAGWVDADVGAPAPTVRGQRPGGGVGLSDRNGPATQPFLLSERDQRERVLPLDAPARTVKAGGQTDANGHMGGHAALFVFDPKHPPVNPDGLATAIRSGGSGHSAPPMWLRTEMTGALAAPVDVPAGTVPKSGNQYLHGRDPGVRNGPATRPELLDRPSPTVSAVGECKGSGEGGNPDKMQRASDALFLGAGIRRLTVTECALLMSWPADYPLQGTKTSQYRIVGNGCTPPVVELLARAVIAADRQSP
jgi:site-specific DNA-cytosine methylase